MLKQQGPQNWQPYKFHHALSISGNHFVLPPIFMIHLVRFGHLTLSGKEPISYLTNLSKNQGGSPPVGIMAMAMNTKKYATNTAMA